MTGHYTGTVEAGKIYTCNTCGVTPKVGDTRYYEKVNDKWLGCTDKECFIQQGGSKDPAVKSGGGKFQVNKHSISEVPKIYALAEGLLKEFKDKRKEQGAISTTDELVFIESLMRTLSGNFKP